jgi:hypothetical protein
MENRHGYCKCGCGEKTKISPETNNAKGWVKGEPRKYVNHHNVTAGGDHAPNWKGGKRKHQAGYVIVSTGINTKEFEHRINAKAQNGGELPDGAIVHHLNHRSDNTSVLICSSHAEHRMIHVRENAFRECGHADWRKCHYCHQWDDPANLTKYASGHYHKKCAANYVAKRRAEKGRKRDAKGRLI